MNESFFKKLYDALQGTTWTMNITAVRDTLTITMAPVFGTNVPPITMSGRPEDFEKEFFAQLGHPLQMVSLSVRGIEDLNDKLKELKTSKEKEITKGKKDQKEKPTEKKPELSKEPVEFPDDSPEEPSEEALSEEEQPEEQIDEETNKEITENVPPAEEKKMETINLFDDI